MSMENIVNLENKEAEEQTSFDFGMAPEEAMEMAVSDTLNVACVVVSCGQWA